jgi:cytochrome c oxidase subunit 2
MTPALQSVQSPAGPDAALLAQLAWLLFGAGAVIFVLVAGLAIASIWRRRWRPSSRLLVIGGGIILPLPLLAALMAWSGWQGSRLTWPFSGAARIQVSVTGHMWWWEVRYRDTRTGREAVLANELRLPAGERVYLALGASDVLHAFWLPTLAGKVDMVPGRLHGLTLRADAPGRHRGQCAEYCGTQHATMALDVVALPAAEFDAWLEHQAQPALNASLRGRDVFLAARCNACHTVRGVAEGGRQGPDLTHLASRSHLGAGALPLNRAALLGWIANPQAAKPGARMPASSLPPEDLQALAGWLETLQ